MLSLATYKAIQIYGIAIVISMLVAVLIKVLVVLTSRIKAPANVAERPPTAVDHRPEPVGISEETVAAISAAISVCIGSHRILHIAESNRSWSNEGRAAQHTHRPR